MNIVALIPARSGSQRVPGKNVKPLGGVPLMCWSIAAARKSAVFGKIIVSTDSLEYAKIATAWDADAVERPGEYATASSPDFDWVRHALDTIMPAADVFAILRPTSPFRTAATIKRALSHFLLSGADSIRAVERVKQHPCKMWVIRGNRLLPLMPMWPQGQPWHSQQMVTLPPVYVQNASLEIAHARVVEEGTISGYTVAPFLTKGFEGFNIDDPMDWALAERIVASGKVEVPK